VSGAVDVNPGLLFSADIAMIGIIITKEITIHAAIRIYLILVCIFPDGVSTSCRAYGLGLLIISVYYRRLLFLCANNIDGWRCFILLYLL
jgi:hypothetical protein